MEIGINLGIPNPIRKIWDGKQSAYGGGYPEKTAGYAPTNCLKYVQA